LVNFSVSPTERPTPAMRMSLLGLWLCGTLLCRSVLALELDPDEFPAPMAILGGWTGRTRFSSLRFTCERGRERQRERQREAERERECVCVCMYFFGPSSSGHIRHRALTESELEHGVRC
jgi:hypothetical protein